MVVNTKNASGYGGVPPVATTCDRSICGGPLYSISTLTGLLEDGGQNIVPWTRGSSADLEKLSLDLDGAARILLEALQNGRYHNSEWCQQRPSGPWAACDAYVLQRSEWIPSAHKEMMMEYYLKLAISKTGSVLLLVSFHP